MVHIHAEFKNVDEMLEFARRLSGLAGVQSAGAVTESYAQEPPATSLTMSAQEGQTPVQQPEKAPSTPVVVPTTQVPAASTVSQAAGVVPTVTQTYTSDDLARAAMALMDAGQQPALIELLKQFGVAALPELKSEQFGAFATALRGRGAPI